MPALLALVSALALALLSCGPEGTPGGGAPGPKAYRQEGQTTIIRIAHSPDVTPLFEALVAAYNQGNRSFRVEREALEYEPLIEAAIEGEVVGISPDASLVLDDLERAWHEDQGDAPPLVGYTTRYATSPVVIAIRSDRMPRPTPTGWETLLKSNARWSHLSSLTTSSGLLTLAAEFYSVASGQKLDRNDVDNPQILERVGAIEKSVARYGGESEEKVVEYLLTPEGGAAIDAMVLSEAQVVSLNQKAAAARLGQWQAIYPEEGTLMMDHPLTLLEHPSLVPEARRAFLDFSRFLSSEQAQQLVVSRGYRPISYQMEVGSGPLTAANGVNPAQPRLLPLPSPGMLAAMKSYWAAGLKRPANILLIVDVSGSMRDGDKLIQAKLALESFVAAAAKKGGRDRIGLDAFSDDYREVVPVRPIAENRQALLAAIRDLQPGGNTALYYAAWAGQQKLLSLKDPDRINAVVLMTDGLENASARLQGRRTSAGAVPTLVSAADAASKGVARDTRPLVTALQSGQRGSAARIVLFTVGYGSGADEQGMRQIAAAAFGQYYFALPTNITKLYTLIQENF